MAVCVRCPWSPRRKRQNSRCSFSEKALEPAPGPLYCVRRYRPGGGAQAQTSRPVSGSVSKPCSQRISHTSARGLRRKHRPRDPFPDRSQSRTCRRACRSRAGKLLWGERSTPVRSLECSLMRKRHGAVPQRTGVQADTSPSPTVPMSSVVPWLKKAPTSVSPA